MPKQNFIIQQKIIIHYCEDKFELSMQITDARFAALPSFEFHAYEVEFSNRGFSWHLEQPIIEDCDHIFLKDFLIDKYIKSKILPSEFIYKNKEAIEFICFFIDNQEKYLEECIQSGNISFEEIKDKCPACFDFPQIKNLLAQFFLSGEFIARRDVEVYLETGRKVHEGMRLGRVESARVRSEESIKNKTSWREMAIQLWKDHPGWTLDDMAQHIRETGYEDYKVSTIKNALKDLKGAVVKRRSE
ncbi:MAG: hypothetical protein HQM03_13045 [Magnetococcales bacterium]|nr:hypothetical protein [Magnetococcales bacterium]